MTEAKRARGRLFSRLFKNLTARAQAASLCAYCVDSGCCGQSFFAGGVYGAQSAGLFVTNDPRHANVLIVTGAFGNRAAPVVREIYDKMPEPKAVMALGVCACTGGIFADNYAVLSDIRSVLPVDVFVTGCPPAQTDFLRGIADLKKIIREKAVRDE